jgi:fimbrial chaperone protein
VVPGIASAPGGARWRLAFLLASALAGTASAGTFSISPIRVELGASQRTAVLTVHNEEDKPVLVQATVLAWKQAGGEDQTEATRDLLVTPPVFTIGPNADQVLRVALRGQPDPARELDYRLLLAEVPGPPEQGFTGLRLALRLSLPVFVTPAHAAPHVEWRLERAADGALSLVAENSGNQHLQLSDFRLRFGDDAHAMHVGVMRYVLPGSRVGWPVTLPEGADPAAALSVQGFGDQGAFEASVATVH